MTKIDLVYLWCDSTDEEWSAKAKKDFSNMIVLKKQRQLIADLLIIMNCCFLCVRLQSLFLGLIIFI